MRLTNEKLKQIIKEELEAVMNEDHPGYSRDNKKKEYERDWDSMSARGGKYLDDDGYRRPRETSWDRERKKGQDAAIDNQTKAADRAYEKAQASRANRAEMEQSEAERGQLMKNKLMPWMTKNAGSLWKKAGANSKEDFIKNIQRTARMSDQELGASEGYEEIQKILGVNLMQSIIRGRSGWQKLGSLLKRGTFSEQLDRRIS